jgi:hypothetical protein
MVTTAVPVWIEDGDGTIVRGVAESVTRGGALVRLAAPPAFIEGSGVALRLSLDPESPTVSATARVSWVKANGQSQCGLEWTSLEAGLEDWLASKSADAPSAFRTE